MKKCTTNIIALIGSKGGVGKSNTAECVGFSLAHNNQAFRMFEIDLSNDSFSMQKSKIFKDKIEIISDATDSSLLNKLIKANLDKSITTILDIGGGSDSIEMLKVFERLSYIKIKYILPVDSSLKNLKNIAATLKELENIGATDINFILNKVFDSSKIEEQFLFWFGNKRRKIKGFNASVSKYKSTFIPYSNFFELAAVDSHSIYDLAEISREVKMVDAMEHYSKKYLIEENDEEAFDTAVSSYLNSQDSLVVVDTVIQNLDSILFD